MKTNEISPNGIVYLLGTALLVGQAIAGIKLLTAISNTIPALAPEGAVYNALPAVCYPMFMVLAAMFVLSQIAENGS